MSGKKGLLIGCLGVVALVVLLAGAIVVFVLNATQPAVDTAERFLQALKTENYTEAYGYATVSLQRELGDAAGLERVIKEAGVQPVEWSFSSRSVEGDMGRIEGTATYADGNRGPIEISVADTGSGWKVIGFRFRQF